MKVRIVAMAAVACAILGARAEVPGYSVQFLGARFTGTGLNEHGVVCGSVSVGTSTSDLLAAVSYNGEPYELLPLPAGMQSSRAHDINDEGVIVGAVCPAQYVTTQPIAAVWRPAPGGYEVEVLGGLPGDPYSAAYAINNLGDIIGASGFWGWNLSTGVQFTTSGPVPLPDGMVGSDINDRRVVLSGLRLLDLGTGQIEEVPLPSGNWQGFVGAALNSHDDFAGHIVGYSGCSTFPMRYRQGGGWEYLGGCATTTSATAINDGGDALLYYSMTTAGVHFVGEGYFALGSLIDPGQGEWYVQYGGANGINNSRQIVASARQGISGPIGAVLLTPLVSADVAHSIRPQTLRVSPNPSNGLVQLEGPSELLAGTTWAVFDVSGRRCGRFLDNVWDGSDEQGLQVPAGIYFVRPVDPAAGGGAMIVRR